ncbi:hypothetical protein TWF694_006134 [Orbilia ellipsospora]|uniref:Uncharacterized protein n=1 Tax=Orbilia ellipsospora TaxID=2528407 RepID=A0AAV9WRE1_9PEZI
MKSIFWTAATVLLSVLPFAQATGSRGAAERALFWFAYEAETELNRFVTDPVYIIAPNCPGSRPGGRCTLYEFLSYLWTPPPRGQVGGPPAAGGPALITEAYRPTPVQVGEHMTWAGLPDGHIDKTVNELVVQIDNWRVVVPHATRNNLRLLMNSWTDVSRIYTDLPNSLASYYTALMRAGNPIGALHHSIETRLPPLVTRAEETMIRDFGQRSALLANYLRIDDFEAKRLRNTAGGGAPTWRAQYNNKFPGGPALPGELPTRQIDKPVTGMAGGGRPNTRVWNAAATLNAVPAGQRDLLRQNLIDLHHYLMDPTTDAAGAGHYRDHIGAIDGVNASAHNSRCPIVPQIDKHPVKRSVRFRRRRSQKEFQPLVPLHKLIF